MDCEQVQANDVLQYSIWEGANRLTSPLPETLSVDSVHSWESKESDLLSCQSININTSYPIHNIFTDSCHVTTNDNHIHPYTNPLKLPIFDGVSFEDSNIFQDDETLHLPLMVMSSPHALDEIYGQLQTMVYEIRISAFESSCISVTLGISPSFQIHHVDHPLYHDRVVDQIE